MKHLSHYREEDYLRMLVGKVQIKSAEVTRTVKISSLIRRIHFSCYYF